MKVHKNALFHTNYQKIFWVWGTAPSPDLIPAGEGDTLSPDSTPWPYAASFTLVISGVTGPILIIFAHDVATMLPPNIFESELSYSYPTQNASLLNKGHFAIFAKN